MVIKLIVRTTYRDSLATLVARQSYNISRKYARNTQPKRGEF